MPETEPIRVFLADDHAIVRRGLMSYLAGEDDIIVVGEADNGRRTIDEIAVLANQEAAPHVVLIDLLMPVLDGIAAIAELHHRWPQIHAIVLTSFLEEHKIQQALDAGAVGYLLKDTDADSIATAIRTVTGGRLAVQGEVATTLLEAARRPPPAIELTPREREVVVLVARGRTNQQIATALGVSERTARTHVSNILGKLGLTSRTQAALWAVDHGITNP